MAGFARSLVSNRSGRKWLALGCAACACTVASTSGAVADGTAQALLDRCVRTEAALKSLETDVTSTGSAQGFTSTVTHGHLTLKRPNLMHAVCTGQMFGRVPFGDCVCDGTNVYALVPGNKLYLKLPITGGLHVVARGLTGIGGDSYPLFFYGVGNTLRASIKLGTLRQAGRLTIDGITCQGLEAEATFAKHTRLIYYIGTDNLVHGEDMVTKERGNTVTVRSRMTRLRVNAAVASEEFVFHAPAGAREHPVGQF